MREKLIELLRACPYRPRPNLMWELIADHLIANGVTFAKDNDVLTNADRIRAMSDEELADKVVCPHTLNWDNCENDCHSCRLHWLQQPAEEG